VDLLKRELGVAPMHDTTLLVQRLLHEPAIVTAHAASPAEEPANTSSELSNPHSVGVDMMLQVCQQLRDIAATLEVFAGSLATAPPSGTGGRLAVPDHTQRQGLTEITAHLGSVVAVVKQGAREDERRAG
jgi:hypothetical protein